VAGPVRLYPTNPSRRRATIARDVLGLVLLAFFAWCGTKAYDVVDSLTALGTAVSDTGTSIQSGFGSVAHAVGGLPLVGDSLANALSGAGSSAGSQLTSVGQEGIAQVDRMALLIGLAVALLPTVVLLLAMVPRRIRQVRALSAAHAVLTRTRGPAARQLLASRAAFGLPFSVLLAHTPDPFGDLAAGRYDALVAAALEDSGMRVPVAG
jgi:hypothetical protein